MKEHWGWAAAAWVGLGLDAGAVASVVKKLSKNIVTLKEAATELGVDVKVLKATMTVAKGDKLNVSLMEAGEFSAKYGDDVQAVTLLKTGRGGKVNVEIISSKVSIRPKTGFPHSHLYAKFKIPGQQCGTFFITYRQRIALE